MHKWCIDIVLKGSGQVLHCLYEGREDNTADVFYSVFNNKPPNEMIGLRGASNKTNMFILAGEIAAVDIYPRKESVFA